MRLHADRLDLSLDPPVYAAAVCAAAPSLPDAAAELRDVATSLRRTAETLRDVLRQLRGLAQPGSLWCGTASDAFAAKLAEPSDAHLDEVPIRYEGYADALSGYAGQLDAARLDLAVARQAAEDAVRTHAVVRARPGASEPDVHAAEHACQFAARRYRDRYDAWVDDVNRCVDRLAVVDDGDHLRNPHGWHAAVDTVAETCGDLSTITAVLGVLALAVCPPAAPVLFAASMATSGAALAADVDRRAQYGEHVTPTDLAFDAMGSLPVTGVAKGARSATLAAAHAPAGVSRGGRAAAAYGRTISRAYRSDLWREPATALRDAHAAGPRAWLVRPSVAPFRENADEVASVGAGCARDTVEHRDEGYLRAAARSPIRVAWAPVADLAR